MKQLRLILTFIMIAAYLHAEDGLPIVADSLLTVTPSDSDDLKNTTIAPYTKFILPAAFISYGALAQVAKRLRRLDENTDKEVSKHFTHRRTFDDYLQYAPVTAVYGLDFMGVKAKNNFRDRTFVVITSHLIMSGTVQAVKMATCVERPDGSNFLSFPSGHTATAFTGAHILFKEYRDVSPWIGVTGYAAATTVGTMRILNRKHWVSDVVAGAGVGILSVEISYLLLPVFRKIIGAEQSQTNLVIMPVVGNNQYGLGMAYVF
jgi:membrane-associated phospholipid phosphatase